MIQVVLPRRLFARLALGDADRHADGVAAVGHQLAVALVDGLGQRVFGFTAEQLGQVDLEGANRADRGAGDGRRLIVRKHNRLLGAHSAARGTALAAIVLVLDQNALDAIDAVDAEQAEVDALQAIGAAAVIDDRVPAAVGLLQ